MPWVPFPIAASAYAYPASSKPLVSVLSVIYTLRHFKCLPCCHLNYLITELSCFPLVRQFSQSRLSFFPGMP